MSADPFPFNLAKMKEAVVVTGLGVVSPIGIGAAAVRAAIAAGRSGVRPLQAFEPAGLPMRIAAEVLDFDPKQYVRPRKSLKVMSREIQLAFAAADQAFAQAAFASNTLDPERFGVTLGSDLIQPDPHETWPAFAACLVDGRFDFARWGAAAMSAISPLWMLKYLPNMPACHVGIAFDARGPNNTITLGEVSSLTAIAEAAHAIERGAADVMLAGGTGSRLMPTTLARHAVGPVSRRNDEPSRAARPFDADRDGEVLGEGAAALVLEAERNARRRGANVLAKVAGFGSAFGRRPEGGVATTAVEQSVRRALADAGLTAADVGLASLHGRSTAEDDAVEAAAVRNILGDVPCTVPSSYFGNLGSGGGAVAAMLMATALVDGAAPPTLNYERPDPRCPLNIVAKPGHALDRPAIVVLNQTPTGQAAALVLTRA